MSFFDHKIFRLSWRNKWMSNDKNVSAAAHYFLRNITHTSSANNVENKKMQHLNGIRDHFVQSEHSSSHFSLEMSKDGNKLFQYLLFSLSNSFYSRHLQILKYWYVSTHSKYVLQYLIFLGVCHKIADDKKNETVMRKPMFIWHLEVNSARNGLKDNVI